MKNEIKKLIFLTIFAMAMAFVESAVVVYLRELYYTQNIVNIFPLKIFKPLDLKTEIFRELATLIMLFSVGYISFEQNAKRIASAFFVWGVWDIFYYIFLKILIGWPKNFADWDILFLIPIPWLAPFIAPVIIAFLFIIFSTYIILRSQKLDIKYLWLIAFGSILIFISFIYLTVFYGSNIIYIVPEHFQWAIYIAGAILMAVGGYFSICYKK